MTVPVFSTITADPPWPEPVDPKWPYPVTSYEAIIAMEVEKFAAERAHLYLWVTHQAMRRGWEVMEAWGFQYQCVLTWTKQASVGYYFRKSTEHILFGTRGKPALKTTRSYPTHFHWPRGRHSAKPEAFYDMVETASPGPYLELFSRRRRLGWHHWGNEVDCDIDLVCEGPGDPSGR